MESDPPQCVAQTALLEALGCFFSWRLDVLRTDKSRPCEISQDAVDLLEELRLVLNGALCVSLSRSVLLYRVFLQGGSIRALMTR